MTNNIPIEDLLPKAGDSIYRLVRIAASRATELAEGKPPLIEKPSSKKETTTALEEIYHGRIVFKDGKVHRVLPEDKKNEKE